MRPNWSKLGRFFFFCFIGVIFLGFPSVVFLVLAMEALSIPAVIVFWVEMSVAAFAILTMLVTALYLHSKQV